MNRPTISVLTDPMPLGRELLHEGARQIARMARDAIRPSRKFFNHPQYRGHFAVTRSLVEGLHKISASFNYNPRYECQLADIVVVLAGVRTLRQAIRMKRQGRIKKLFAGPNIVVFSSDYDSLLAATEVDGVITPCDWVVDIYIEDNPSLKNRIFSWPAGVDTNYWQQDPSIKRDGILIFDKQNKGSLGLVSLCGDYLRNLGWPVQVIEYGKYTHNEYLQMLQHSCLVIGFVASESQGIAWAEAWSTDVPTLICKNISNIYRGRRYDCSTAPYLHPQNGLFFDDLEDFKKQFGYWLANREQFTPRVWTLENMSDEVCADLLYRHVLGKET
jgi:hypothetical protein